MESKTKQYTIQKMQSFLDKAPDPQLLKDFSNRLGLVPDWESEKKEIYNKVIIVKFSMWLFTK